MVQVRALLETESLDQASFANWLAGLATPLDTLDQNRLIDAFVLLREQGSEQSQGTMDWAGDADVLSVGLETVQILAELRLGPDALIAGFLYRSVRQQVISIDTLRHRFGDKVASLLDGVLRMAAVSDLTDLSDVPVLGQSAAPNINIRRMLVAIVDDVRVALIKLAERTVAMRGLKGAEEHRQQRIAWEVFNVYAPLADRLGVGHLKWELEDLSFRYTNKDAYHRIASLLDGRRQDRDSFIARVNAQLTQTLTQSELAFEITGRAKHIYSIWRKMQRKGIGFSQVHDIRALRILVDDVAACYQTLGVVHGMWRNIPNEFDDYIASPKENGYRSLHTAVIGPEGKILEVQIRTEEMHEEAELGVCAHWRYKASEAHGAGPDTYEEKLSWLRQVLEWHETVGDDEVVAEQFTFDSAQDRVYVFTPKGDVVSLVHGATPLDFAYHVHTEVGHRCRGARVNGTLVPLTYVLGTGERVEILTASTVQPRRDWLSSSSGFLRTARARNRVQQWFKSQNRDDNVAAGRELVERECARLALTSLDYKAMSGALGLDAVDDMFAAVGSGDLTSKQVLRVAKSVTHSDGALHPEWAIHPQQAAPEGAARVDGVGNLLTQFAGCCLPVPGDGIEGYITRSGGVTVHRADCARLLALHDEYPERIIAVNWGAAAVELFPVDIELTAYDRQGLLADVTLVLAQASANVTSINTQSHPDNNTAHMRLRAEVSTIDALMELLAKLHQLDNVISAKRVVE
ncbi:MAG: bifunctional (p)ppGpp synthetase/guanosine-3',5'-bis(diphosphate) 3'-pyrophosphohydrolase [Halieaceae bacterium]|nr:bifunctional (p)ppGpp synthetase/guanosine-3',5'-bis(diphosphate) 3'-pyrophosphohydrolase [Halieaceae bacterium]